MRKLIIIVLLLLSTPVMAFEWVLEPLGHKEPEFYREDHNEWMIEFVIDEDSTEVIYTLPGGLELWEPGEYSCEKWIRKGASD